MHNLIGIEGDEVLAMRPNPQQQQWTMDNDDTPLARRVRRRRRYRLLRSALPTTLFPHNSTFQQLTRCQ